MEHAVLLITFNRPKYVKVMLNALKNARIPKLYVFKDGPRPNNMEDYEASKEIESLISSIDWGCDVRTNYMQNNLGCGYGPFSAISWAFQYEEDLIILEDDCIPIKSFFEFSNKMLEQYKNDERIRLVAGYSQMTEHPVFKDYDYIYSQYAPTWGWATWKRVWNNFDLQMRELDEFFKSGGFTNQFSSSREAAFFNRRYKRDRGNMSIVFHIWDSQFGYHIRKNGALGIIPAKNLIKYIGIDGTHPVEKDSDQYNLITADNFEFDKYPRSIEIIADYDRTFFDKFAERRYSFQKILSYIKRKLKVK